MFDWNVALTWIVPLLLGLGGGIVAWMGAVFSKLATIASELKNLGKFADRLGRKVDEHSIQIAELGTKFDGHEHRITSLESNK